MIWEETRHVLAVKGLPDDWNESDVRKSNFKYFGNLAKVWIKRKADKPTVIFIKYDTESGADEAVVTNGKPYLGSILSITRAQRKVTPKPDNTADESDSNKTTDYIDMESTSVQFTSTPLSTKSLGIEKLDLNGDTSDGQQTEPQMSDTECSPPMITKMKRMPSMKRLNFIPNEDNRCLERPDQSMDGYVSCVTIDALRKASDGPYKLLHEVFSHLTLKQRFGITRVCYFWRSVVQEMAAQELCVTFGLKETLSCGDWRHNTSEYNDLSAAITAPDGTLKLDNSVYRLAPFFRGMHSVECVHLANCHVTTQALKWIIATFHNLKCLRFDDIHGIVRTDWTKFVKPLAGLTHFSFAGNTLNEWQSVRKMVSSFVALEVLIVTDCIQDMEFVFRDISPTLHTLAIIRCDRLTPQSIRRLTGRNGPHIREIYVDFKFIHDSFGVIEAIYELLTELESFRALNISGQTFTEFNHYLLENNLSITMNAEPIADTNQLFALIGKELSSVEMRGPVFPNLLKNLTANLPVCQDLKLIDCDIHCDCGLDLQVLAPEERHSCQQ
ncbi:unnamed protein product [Medioppia subpectinata]|uniref:RRM domain-containing protein n=1 Tax=Medioppia subpectinata TaxID=1979941 RepID=A0A7R9KTK2_9ACAR|nr:unnamed protein product [Medioppia subpectinata]CAG2109569.1 unnamed protein product [Medioppia subpectinata]